MQVETLSLENQIELRPLIRSYQQLLPFFYSHDRARENFLTKLGKSDSAQFSFVKDEHLLGVISYQLEQNVLTITDLLISPNLLMRQSKLAWWFGAVEKQAKILGAQSLCLNLLDVDLTLGQRLEKIGFVTSQTDQGKLLAKKELDYHTALVLAGGGARGAYQIGVWRALRELGITYKIITGTSVGALNGALIAQGDFSVAEEMWSAIETEQILSYPHQEKESTFTPLQMLKEVQQFAQSALTNQGVSTAPLAALISGLLDEEKLLAAGIDLYLCTTELPSVKERVVSLAEAAPGTYKEWLLASSSFFPAMAATKIDEHFYVDGGYRNNIPVDVALQAGGTELIVIDVKGPGLTKSTKVPAEIPQRIIASPWSLGTVLLFDGARSHWNLELGYLEGLKAFGQYRGYWYTYQGNFSEGLFRQEVASLLKEFKQTFTVAEKEIFKQQELINNFSRRISPLYQERLTEPGLFLYLLELVAKVVEVKPTKLYTLSELIIAIKTQVEGLDQTKQSTTQAEMLLSLAEWGKRLLTELPLPLENQQIHYLATIITEVPADPSLLILAKLTPLNYLTAKLLTQIHSLELVVEGLNER